MTDHEESALQFIIPSPFATPTVSPQCPSQPKASQKQNQYKNSQMTSQVSRVKMELDKNQMKAASRAGKAAFKKLGIKHFKGVQRSSQASSRQTPFSNSQLTRKINQGYSTLTIMRGGNCQSVNQAQKQPHQATPKRSARPSTERSSKCQEQIQKAITERRSGLGDKQEVDEMFRTLNRKIEQEQQVKRGTKNKKGFYNNLKRKLQTQIKLLKNQKTIDEKNRLIQGCQQRNHMRGVSCTLDIRSIAASPRPGTSYTRSGVDISPANADRYKRPQSSRERIIDKKEMQRMIHTVREEEKRRPYSARSSKGQKKMRKVSSGEIAGLEPNCSQALYTPRPPPRTKSSLEKSRSEEKLIKIMLQCDEATRDTATLRKGVKVFGYYCRKVGEGLGRVSEMLDHAVTQNIEGYDED